MAVSWSPVVLAMNKCCFLTEVAAACVIGDLIWTDGRVPQAVERINKMQNRIIIGVFAVVLLAPTLAVLVRNCNHCPCVALARST